MSTVLSKTSGVELKSSVGRSVPSVEVQGSNKAETKILRRQVPGTLSAWQVRRNRSATRCYVVPATTWAASSTTAVSAAETMPAAPVAMRVASLNNTDTWTKATSLLDSSPQ